MDDTSVLMILIIIGSHVSLDHKENDPDHCHEDMKTFFKNVDKCLGQRGVSGCQGCQVGAFGWPAFGYFLCDLTSLCICRYHP